MMTDDKRIAVKVMAWLLAYPDDTFRSALPELRAVKVENPGLRGKIVAAIDSLADVPLRNLQEAYTRAFDIDPATSLNVTAHLFGEGGGKRGAALAFLNQIYHEAGYDAAASELPDHLPTMLEFWAEAPEASGADFVKTCLKPVIHLARRLKASDSLYAGILTALAECLETDDTPDLDLSAPWRESVTSERGIA